MSTYTVTAERSGKWWVLQATEVPGAISQVARLDQADQIREAIAFVAGVSEADVEIEVVPIISDEIREHIRSAAALRIEALEANSRSAAESRAAARALKDAGLTLRDIGSIMDVSFQRAAQLVDSSGGLSDTSTAERVSTG